MINTIRMDFTRMLKSVSTWVLLIVLVVTTFLSVLMLKATADILTFATSSDNAFAQEFSQGFEAGYSGAAGLYSENQVPAAETLMTDATALLKSDYLCTSLGTGSTYIIIMAIFMVLFVNGETKSGFIKNISNHVPSKGMLVISKMLCAVVFAAMMIILGTGTVYLSQLILVGTECFTDFSQILFVDGMFLLLTVSFAALVMFITILCRSAAGGMVSGLVIATGLTTLLVKFADWLISEITGAKDFTIADYTLTANNISINTVMELPDIVRIIIVAVAWLAVTTAVSVVLYSKRDIK